MKFDVKKLLLTGTAMVAFSSFAGPAHAFTATLTGDVEWGDAGPSGADGDGTDATADDDAVLTTHTLTVTNDTSNTDGSVDTDTFALGDVTATTGSLIITDGTAADLSVTVTSFTSSGAGDFSVIGTDANTAGIDVLVANDLTSGGNLLVVNQETNAADDIVLTVGGAVTVEGTTDITAGNGGAATASLTATGDTAFTGAVTVTAGDTAGGDATLILNGDDNAFDGGLTLDGTAGAGIASLQLTGSDTQTISGDITNAGGNTEIIVDNDSAASFEGTVAAGTITIEKAAGNSIAIFGDDVTADIQLGGDGNADDVNLVSFDSLGGDLTVTGSIAGTAGEDNYVLVMGGNTVTLTGGPSTADIGLVTLAESGTVLTTDQNLTADDFVVGTGATLETTANTIAGDVTLTGTLHLAGGDVTGDIDGSSSGVGTIDMDADATITGDIGATKAIAAIDIITGQTLTTTGDINATTTTLNGTGELRVTSGATVNTDVVAAADGDGFLTILDGAGTTAITGDVGQDGKSVGEFAVNGAAAQTVTTTGNLYADNINIDDADTLQFLGSSSQTVSGLVTGGIVTVGNGSTDSDVTFAGGGTSIASATVSAGATARHMADFTTDGAYTNNGSAYVDVGDTVTADSFGGTGAWRINLKDDGDGIANAADHGTLNSANAIDTSGGDLVVNFTGSVESGSYTIGTGGAGTALGTVSDNSFQYGSSVSVDGANDYILTVTRAAIDDLATGGNNQNAGAVLETLNDSTNPQIAAAIDNLASASTQKEFDEVIESTLPTVDGGAMTAALNASDHTLNIAAQRLSAVRWGYQTGMPSGNGYGYDYLQGHRVWAQGFGQTASQDRRDNMDGYDADTYGLAVGADTETLIADGIVGVAFSYANTSVDSKNANRTDTDVDSYQLTVYGDYDLDATTWVSGMVAYAWNDTDTVRHNVGGVSGLNANGSFDAHQFTAQATVGRDFHYDSMIVTPNLLAHWTHYAPDDYTETGAGGLSNAVSQDSLDVLQLGVGVQAAWLYESASGMDVEPQLHAGYRYDLIGDSVDATARYTGGGAAYSLEGMDPARSSFNIGGGAKFYTTNNWEFTANYDFDFKADYAAHSAFVRAGMKL